MKDEIVLEGTVESIVYQNPENGYTVFSILINEKENDDIMCIAYIPKINVGESIKVKGHYTIHPTYGKQLTVESYEKVTPTTEKGIEKYLGSGAIKGVGETLALRIVKEFGKSTLDVIEKTPEKLSSIRGIS